MRSFWAKLNLAWGMLLHFLRKPFRENGYQAFLDQYRGDRLVPMSTVDKNWLERFSRCFNCGLCDAVCPALETLPRESFPGPSFLVTTLARNSADFWAAGIDTGLCEGCRLCESACPNQVPVKEAIEFIETKALETKLGARPGRRMAS